MPRTPKPKSTPTSTTRKLSVPVPPPAPASPPPAALPAAARLSAAATPPPAARQAVVVEDALESPVALRLGLIGVGQAGGRMVQAFWEQGYRAAVVVNTTDLDFAGLPDGLPVLDLATGGAAKDPRAAAAMWTPATQGRVKNVVQQSLGTGLDLVLVCAGLGGGTGSGLAAVLARMAQSLFPEARTGACVSLPTEAEGTVVAANAVQAYAQLSSLGPLIVVDNQQVDKIHHPAFARLFATANNAVAGLLHCFNEIAATRSDLITFDQAELSSVLREGLVLLGSSSVAEVAAPADVATAVRSQLDGQVIASGDLSKATAAACVFLVDEALLDQLGTDYFEAGFEALADRLAPGAVVHRGVYRGGAQGLQVLVAVGGAGHDRDRLRSLWRRAGDRAAGEADPLAVMGMA